MALEYRYTPRDGGAPVDTVTVDRHWYLTEDKDRVVPENDPAARWLWATPGMDVPRADAEKLGAVEPVPAESDVEESGETVKETPAPPNKQRTNPGDKSGSKPADIAELREQATKLGVQVDNRWGEARLRREIAAAAGED